MNMFDPGFQRGIAVSHRATHEGKPWNTSVDKNRETEVTAQQVPINLITLSLPVVYAL